MDGVWMKLVNPVNGVNSAFTGFWLDHIEINPGVIEGIGIIVLILSQLNLKGYLAGCLTR